jgi:hypothetical protein
MKWLAGKFGAGRTGYLYCFLALVVPYLVAGLSVAAIAAIAAMLGLDDPIVLLAGALVAILIGLLVFSKILDTTVLRGLGIAVTTTIATWVIGVAMTFGVAMLGIGGTSIAALAELANNAGTLADGGLPSSSEPGASRAQKPKSTREFRLLKSAVSDLCECVSEGGDCRAQQAKLNPLIERIDANNLPAHEAGAVFDLQIKGAQCLADAIAGETMPKQEPSVASQVSSQAPGETPGPSGASVSTTTRTAAPMTSAGTDTVALATAKAYANPPPGTKYGYREVDVARLDDHIGKLIRVKMVDGEERADVLYKLTATVVILRQGKLQGSRTYELPRDGIRQIRVLGRW